MEKQEAVSGQEKSELGGGGDGKAWFVYVTCFLPAACSEISPCPFERQRLIKSSKEVCALDRGYEKQDSPSSHKTRSNLMVDSDQGFRQV